MELLGFGMHFLDFNDFEKMKQHVHISMSNYHNFSACRIEAMEQ